MSKAFSIMMRMLLSYDEYSNSDILNPGYKVSLTKGVTTNNQRRVSLAPSSDFLINVQQFNTAAQVIHM